MTEVMFLRGEPCVRCTGDTQMPSETAHMLCEDHFRDVAVVHFARRNHPNPVQAATSAMDGGLRAVSAPLDVGLPTVS
ncbi:hypothetical protein EDD92_2032 [Streptomyces sp. TLI_185]|nr:hypothetical protein EDD92_2032 [Streptomyces sp. TLI_185]